MRARLPVPPRGELLPRWAWFALGLAALGWAFSPRPPTPVDPGPGAVAPRPPVQEDVRGTPPARIGDFAITPLHSFRVEARVLSREDYRFGTEAELSPTDLALGWGRMSDSAVLAGLDISQGGRFFYYRWGPEGPPIPQDEIIRSASNMHLVPADETVADALARVRPGQVVDVEGWLVRADRADGWRWVSSTRRDDTGAGACELVVVSRLVAR